MRAAAFFSVLLATVWPLIAAAGAVDLQAIHADDAYQRWRDVASNAYFSRAIDYTLYDRAGVTMVYDDSGPAFAGSIAGAGLKPFFAYQFKLEGKPSWPIEPDKPGQTDDWSNEQLGRAGRWWCSKLDSSGVFVAGWNSTDDEYNTYKVMGFWDGTHRYVFTGYVLFDFVITDERGSFAKGFACDSSYHVLWKTTQVGYPDNSSETVYVDVIPAQNKVWYGKRPPRATYGLGIYAERQGESWGDVRALPGELTLTAGTYAASLRLTEESFHESGTGAGSWASVMEAPVTFAIGAPQPYRDIAVAAISATPSELPYDALVGTAIDVTVANLGNVPGNTESLSVTLADAGGTVLETKTVSGLANGATTTVQFTWTPSGIGEVGVHEFTARVTAPDLVPDANDAKTVSVTVTDPTAPTTLYAELTGLTTGSAGKNTYAVAHVSVTNAPPPAPGVANATVTVTWSTVEGGYLGTTTGTTDTAGNASVRSPNVKGAATFTAAITNVTADGYGDFVLVVETAATVASSSGGKPGK